MQQQQLQWRRRERVSIIRSTPHHKLPVGADCRGLANWAAVRSDGHLGAAVVLIDQAHRARALFHRRAMDDRHDASAE